MEKCCSKGLSPIELTQKQSIWAAIFVGLVFAFSQCLLAAMISQNGWETSIIAAFIIAMSAVVIFPKIGYPHCYPHINPSRVQHFFLWVLLGGVVVELILCLTGIVWNFLVQQYYIIFLHQEIVFQKQNIVEIIQFLEQSSDTIRWRLWGVLLYTIVVAPLLEEVFFRYFMYRLLKNRTGAFQAMLICSAWFAFLHMNLMVFGNLMMMGICLCCIYEKTKNLWIPCAIHGFNNALVVLMLVTGIWNG